MSMRPRDWDAEPDPERLEYLDGMTAFARSEIPEAASVTDPELRRLIALASPRAPLDRVRGIDLDVVLDQVLVNVQTQLRRRLVPA